MTNNNTSEVPNLYRTLWTGGWLAYGHAHSLQLGLNCGPICPGIQGEPTLNQVSLPTISLSFHQFDLSEVDLGLHFVFLVHPISQISCKVAQSLHLFD